MLIDQLPEANTLENSDEFPMERDTSTMKTRLSTLIAKLADTFLRKAGDTMTGNLNIEKNSPAVILRASNNVPGVNPSSNVYSQIQVYNSEGTQTGVIAQRQTTNKSQEIFLMARNTESGSAVTNTLSIGVNASGDPTVQISDPDPWLSALKAGEYHAETASAIADAESGCEITQLQYQEWGKVAQLRITVKKTAAVSSGVTTLATLKTGRRPKMNSPAQVLWGNGSLGGLVGASGAIQVNGAITAGQSISIMAVYLLA